MGHGFVFQHLSIVLLAAAAALPPAAASSAQELRFLASAEPGVDRNRALVVRRDGERARTWVLGVDGVRLLEDAGARPSPNFRLRGWIHVASPGVCAPDLLVDADGTAIVSSNITPDLWRVDPDLGTVTALKVALEPDREREIGFTALRFAGRDSLHAESTTDRSHWRIDLRSGRAELIDAGVCSACQSKPGGGTNAR